MDDPENSAEYAAMDFNAAATTGTTSASRNTAIPIPKGSVGTGGYYRVTIQVVPEVVLTLK